MQNGGTRTPTVCCRWQPPNKGPRFHCKKNVKNTCSAAKIHFITSRWAWTRFFPTPQALSPGTLFLGYSEVWARGRHSETELFMSV